MIVWNAVVTAIMMAVACAAASIDGAAWENLRYTRTIDLSRSYVKETGLILVKNLQDSPSNEYYLTVGDGNGFVTNISAISAALVDLDIPIEPELVEPFVYKLTLPVPVAPQCTLDIKVRFVYVDALQPLPGKIDLAEKQNLLLKLNKFAFSPYKTKDYTLSFGGITKGQEMEITTANLKASENVPDVRPEVQENTLQYGPVLETLEPYTIQPMGLLYEHNRPLTSATNYNRSIWLPGSEVGSVLIEEYYELTNKGAELLKGFLRVEWMKGKFEQSRNHFALSHLEYNAKELFDDYYVTDLVGQVSSHRKIANNLLIQPRFPIFGGWKYNFTLGYHGKLGDYVHKVNDEPDTYVAKIPLLNTLRDATYGDVYLSFYLPENAEFIDFSSPIAAESLDLGNERSYLDVSDGHVKVTLHYKNLFDDLSHLDVFIKYRYTKTNYWWKVIKIAGFVFIGLTSYFLLSLIDISIENKEKK